MNIPLVYGPPQSERRIENILKKKDELLVQVMRDTVRDKGVKLTTHLSIVSRRLVLYPERSRAGVSSKISPKAERKRLREILEEIAPPGCGLIARTNSAELNREELVSAMNELLERWEQIKKSAEACRAPKLLYEAEGMISCLLRDIRLDTLEAIVTDDAEFFRLLQKDIPDPSKVKFYEEALPLFARYGVEKEVTKMINRKVSLPSGGYIVVDQTEALTAIDVNTGHFVGKTDLEQTVFETNLEAAAEIARILRLRNIGGIIIVDFIDMQNSENREKVTALMNSLLSKDRSKAFVVDITPLGLMEITRKRTGENFGETVTEPCEFCGGRGAVRDIYAVCSDVLREIKTAASRNKGGKVLVETSPAMANLLFSSERQAVAKLETDCGVTIEIVPKASFRRDAFSVASGSYISKEGKIL
jgi:ribonuclease G